MEDALEEDTNGKSDYQKGIKLNQDMLEKKHPCQIQLERMEKYGSYRGTTVAEIDGEQVSLSNVFTISAYRKEIQTIFEVQKRDNLKLTDQFEEKYMQIFNRKRKYYEGPGNEASRTDYGIYTTQIDENTGVYITENNLFDKLIGVCKITGEQRAAGASYTAQEFNALNDLNNLTVNGRKLEQNEKEQILENYKNQTTVSLTGKSVRKIITKVVGEIEELRGARIDKDEKEIFHTMETYRKMKKELEKIGLSIEKYSVEELNDIAWVLTLNTDREGIEAGMLEKGFDVSLEELEFWVSFRKKNGKMFSKWQSFSVKLMQDIIPIMYEQPKEQMTILSEMGYIKTNIEKYKGLKKIPTNDLLEEIYNPVVRRSIRITISIFNELLKKYGYPEQIVIEMPRDKNDEEAKKRINKFQKNREKELKGIENKIEKEYGKTITEKDYRGHKGLQMKLKLWNEQNGMCLYSGKAIDVNQLIDRPNLFEVDHIIPRSISLDDSRNNKVLVFATENQNKGNRTPYHYFIEDDRAKKNFEQYKAEVIDLKKKNLITKKKLENLLNMQDITKQEVIQGFISRNLNDTRYASRVVLNTIQDFCKANNKETKVKVIRGAFTHQMRIKLSLDKDREKSFAHHAEDAALIAYSQMGYDAYRECQENIIDFETGEILDKEHLDEIMSDDFYENLVYNQYLYQIKCEIKKVPEKVKYWHKVDRKANRGLCNQTIRGTRTYDNTIYKINKIDIRTKEGVALFKKKLEGNKEEDFLMKREDPRTFEILKKIYMQYKDEKLPFNQYEIETGEVIRKFSKKNNGPKISMLKYTDGEVGSCIDISHKYGHENNSKKVILESLAPFRMDVYYDEKKKQYCLIGVKYADCKYKKGKYIIDKERYVKELVREKLIKTIEDYEQLEEIGIRFVMSFYKDEYISYEKNGKIYTERFLSRTMPNVKNYIETKPINAQKFEKQKLVGLSKTSSIKKIRCDILGNRYCCDQEMFSWKTDV